jgi:hypothetical protein
MRTGRAHLDGVRPASRRLLTTVTSISLLLVALAVVLTSAASAEAGARVAEAPTAPWLNASGAVTRLVADAGARPRRLAGVTWVGGTYPVAGGQVSVYVSNSYADAESTAAGVAPAAVAAHEYGHHVAANRVSPPRLVLDWGTKRWASYEGVCARVAAKTAFPGDEGLNYSLNPGEAFAETFRVDVETGGTGVGFTWPIIDASYRPDAQALAAVREDTLHPWVGATSTTIRGRFAKGRPTWSTTLATPLDGDLRVDVASAADLTWRSADGRRILARGSWNSTGRKSATYLVCGARSLQVWLRRNGAAARFTLRMTIP